MVDPFIPLPFPLPMCFYPFILPCQTVPGQPLFGPFPHGFNRWRNSPRTRPRGGDRPCSGSPRFVLCSLVPLQGRRHLPPRIGAMLCFVDDFDPAPVIGAAKVGSTLSDAFVLFTEWS
jgi:hypothetical protein